MVDLLEKRIMPIFLAGFCLAVGEHERFVTTTEFRRNAIIPRMLLESFDCHSWSNRPCAAKVQNNMCWMVGKIQRGCQHLESRSRQSNGWWTNHQAISFSSGCFRGWKSRLGISSFLAFSFMVLSFAFVLGIILACAFIRLVRAKTHPSGSHHCLLTSLFVFLFFGPPNCVLFLPARVGNSTKRVQVRCAQWMMRAMFSWSDLGPRRFSVRRMSLSCLP